MGKKHLRYTRRGWFSVLRFLTGTRDLYTGATIPDEYGCTERQLLVGPYPSAAEAMAKGW